VAEGPAIVVDHARVVVGRSANCDVTLDSINVSRRHCSLTPQHDHLEVQDLGSRNGTRINGHRIAHGRLCPGDELSIAHIRYILAAAWHWDLVTLARSAGPDETSGEPGDHRKSKT
jgi:pSer/pThr/pTyr-binding forkhead associated (FHA) protein